MKKIFSIFLIISMLLSFAACELPTNSGTDTGNDTDAETKYPHSDMELSASEKIVAHSKSIDVPVFFLKYFFLSSYNTFCEEHTSDLGNYLDTNIPLHDQNPEASPYDNYETWFDYFLASGKEMLEYYLALYEKAVENDIKLTDAEIATIDEWLNDYKKAAEANNMTFEEYMSQMLYSIGEDVTYDLMRSLYIMCETAKKMLSTEFDNFEYTDEEIEKIFNEKSEYYLKVDYNICTIFPESDQSDSNEEIEAAKKVASALADEFVNYVKSGLTYPEAYRKIYPNKTQTQYADFDENYAFIEDSYYYYDGEEEKNTDESLWLFAEGRYEGEITVLKSQSGLCRVVQIVKLPYRQMYKVPNIRMIFLSLQDGAYTETTAKEKCNEIVDAVKSAENKTETFISFVEEYSSDINTNKFGGLIEDIVPNYSSLPTDLVKWCYEDGRGVGDASYFPYVYGGYVAGYFIVTIDSYGLPYWQYCVESYMRTLDTNEQVDLWIDTYSIEYDKELADSIYK